MRLGTILTTFAALFLAELGDKTQLTILALVTGGRDRLSVFLGASAALVASSLVAVVAGEALVRVVDPNVLRIGAGLLLLGFGVFVLREGVVGLRG
jgi:Ca2+/H+ antiporter, TMEM165/GDT1 family